MVGWGGRHGACPSVPQGTAVPVTGSRKVKRCLSFTCAAKAGHRQPWQGGAEARLGHGAIASYSLQAQPLTLTLSPL